MSRPRRPKPQRWPTSQIIVVALAAAPFLFLIWAVIASKRADAVMTERVATTFQEVDCEVTEVALRPLTRIETINGRKQTVASGADPIIEYQYTVAGQVYRSRRFAPAARTLGEAEGQSFLAHYDEGTHHRCRYDPADPALAFIAP
jgi:hypothetical protein